MVWVNPITWASGVLTSANLNTLRDSLKAIGDPWTSYSPSWTTTGSVAAIGNGSLTGQWLNAGQDVRFRIKLTIGSTTALGSGSYAFSLPFQATSAEIALGPAMVRRSASRYVGMAYTSSSTNVAVLMASSNSRFDPATPISLTTGDSLDISGFYERA